MSAPQALIFTEICFGDDISTPCFLPLIKKDELAEMEDEISEKESLMDELIMSMALDEFSPVTGPVDPTIQVLRDSITRRILRKPIPAAIKGSESNNGQLVEGGQQEQESAESNIELYFEKIVARDDVVSQLKELFPIKEVYEKKAEKVPVVRKRPLSPDPAPAPEAIKNEPSGIGSAELEKKIKVEKDQGPIGKRDDFDADFLVS
jgi:hypothetical protein